MKRCFICEKGTLESVGDIVIELEGYIFIVKGERCNVCKEEIPHEEETKRVIDVARQLGVWPEAMKLYGKLSKSGGSLVLRVPADLERQMNLKENTPIAIVKHGRKIILETEV